MSLSLGLTVTPLEATRTMSSRLRDATLATLCFLVDCREVRIPQIGIVF